MTKEYATYWVAFKLLLEKDGKFLFLIPAGGRRVLDLPGGRADSDEGEVPLKKILEREVREELGDNIKYSVAGPIFQYRRHLIEKKIYILITVYKAEYISGQIELSSEHNEHQWIDPKEYKFKEEEFYIREEQEAFKEYFKKYELI
jgi:8-oxo-dGTP pyrophosphatase MutT (NUDIX family)